MKIMSCFPKFNLVVISILLICSCDHLPVQSSPPQEKVATILTLSLSAHSIKSDQPLTFSGNLSPLRNSETTNPLGLPVLITLQGADGSLTKVTTKVIDNSGYYEISPVDVLEKENLYTVTASFAGSATLKTSSSDRQFLRVGICAGYAIIFQGTPPDEEQTFISQSMSSFHVYQTMLSRGLQPENIQVLQPTDSSILPKLQNAFIQAAELNRTQPAPLYLVFISKGKKSVMQAGSEELNVEMLAELLKNYENTPPTGPKPPVVLFLAAPGSGSFIPRLSAKNRVIISSCQENEFAWQGSLVDGKFRYADFFLQEMFANLAGGLSLNAGFREAGKATARYTRSGTKPCNTINEFSMQHPLIDDNGDKKGSKLIFSRPDLANQDGMAALTWYLGFDRISLEEEHNVVHINEVTETKTLAEEENSALLWLKADGEAGQAWLEIRAPGIELGQKPPPDIFAEQLPLKTVIHSLKYDVKNDIWQTMVNDFNEFGMYEIVYYVRHEETSSISGTARSLVFRGPGDQELPPPVFSLFPQNNAELTTTGQIFSWQPAATEDFTYVLEISKSSSPDSFMENLVFRREGIKGSNLVVDFFNILQYGNIYYYRVRARNCFGLLTPEREEKTSASLMEILVSTAEASSGPSPPKKITFSPEKFGLPMTVYGCVQGYLNSLINGSFVTLNTASSDPKTVISGNFTSETSAIFNLGPEGFYMIPTDRFGTADISCSNLGYEEIQHENISVGAEFTINKDLNLSRDNDLFNPGMTSIAAGTGSVNNPVIIVSGIPTLQWDCITGATKYRVEVTNSQGVIAIFDNITSCSQQLTDICDSTHGPCNWRFRPESTQTGPWSDPMYFWHLDTNGDGDIDGADIANIVRFHTIDGIILAKLANAL